MKKNTQLPSKEEIIDKISKEKKYLSENFFITEIGLFGSYVRDEQKQKSDIDILIEYDHKIGISLFEIVRLQNYLSDLFGVKVDLALKGNLKPTIGSYILREVIFI